MAGERETKLCRFCYEETDARAKRCPHCRMHQTRWAWSFHPAAIVLVLALCLVLYAATVLSLMAAFRKGKDFAEYQDQLEILRPEMVYEEEGERSVIGVIGQIKNNSDIPWDEIQMEAQFRDQDDQLVDVLSDTLFVGELRPGSVRFFRLWGYAYLPEGRYASYEVRVTGSKEAGSFPW